MMNGGKPNSKQGQQAILLAVLGVTFVGVAIYGVAGSLSQPAAAPGPPPAAAAPSTPNPDGETPHGTTPEGTTPGGTTPGGTPAVAGVEVKPGGDPSALQLPEVANADPFKPALPKVSNSGPAKPTAGKPASAPVRIAEAARSLPNVSVTPVPSAPAAPVKPVAPPPPPRPQVAVTGIIDAEGGADMALIDLGTEHRIIQLGDMLPGNYQVKRIAMDGVLLVSGTDRYFVALGNKAEGAPVPGGNPS